MKVKICGITNFDDAVLACSLGADAIGFIFYNQSKRFVEYEDAGQIISLLPEDIIKIGVFVDTEVESINDISESIGLSAIQLHGDESQEIIDKINLPVWKVFRVSENFDFNILNKYKNCTVMLDTYSEDEYGGTGHSFNWDVIPKDIAEKIVLAGGISSENIEHIYRNISPAWVDLSSSLELCPGKKDEIKLKEFFDKINKLRKS